jgi:GNAT superfamily N-acetyltransferase
MPAPDDVAIRLLGPGEAALLGRVAEDVFDYEVGVAPTHQGRGVGRRLLGALTDQANSAARRLYAAAGGTESTEPIVMVSFSLDSGAAGT